MRTWLYDTLTTNVGLQSMLGGVDGIGDRVIPRESQSTINRLKPFIVYGLGNATAEGLADSTDPDALDPQRQFSQIWIHDDGGDYGRIDSMVELVKAALIGKGSVDYFVLTTRYLETSQEFANETYNTIFRYVRFQHIIAQGVPIP